jgi:hypothetical protein
MSITLTAVAGGAAPPESEAGEEPGDAGWVILGERPGEGEQCLVCGKRIFGTDVVQMRYQGRTFFVGAPFVGQFELEPDKYFAKLQMRSALFDERAVDARPIAMGWLWFGFYAVTGLLFSAVCGYVAVGKSLSPIRWFFAGLVGNVVAFVVLLLVPKGDTTRWPCGVPRGFAKVSTTRAPSRCPACGALNHPSAHRCGGCGGALEATVEAETGRV